MKVTRLAADLKEGDLCAGRSPMDMGTVVSVEPYYSALHPRGAVKITWLGGTTSVRAKDYEFDVRTR